MSAINTINRFLRAEDESHEFYYMVQKFLKITAVLITIAAALLILRILTNR